MIATPPFLIGACLLFWGWQTGNWIAAGVLALLVETLRRLPLRFDLGTTEHTIKVHRRRVMEKFEADSLADLVRFASDLGIAPVGQVK